MAIISIQNVELVFGGLPLFDGINLSVEPGEKIALVGRNGSGKSTLLRLIEGSRQPDAGAVAVQKGNRAALLAQEVPQETAGTIYEVVASGLKEHSDLIARHHEINSMLSMDSPPGLLQELNQIHNALDAVGGWGIQQQTDKIISHLGLDADLVFNTLSAGLKRQALLGKALAGEPDILLLDEPTNHMDIDSIERLEEYLLRFSGAVVFVTHDRMFLQKLASRIVEIDRGELFDQACDYQTFLVRRESVREAKETEQVLFDKRLATEERWVRQGIKARRTRNEGRVRELEKMRQQRRERRDPMSTVKMEAYEAGRSGKLVIKARDISYKYGDIPIISNFSTTILKGDRVGILGPNGSGKTTLLRILLGDLQPASGSVKLGTGLQISYFDQLREQLDISKSVRENIGEGKDIITLNGKDRHVIGYLKDFFFSADLANSPVSLLSGGERNRLVLARLFTRPSNLLVLDEPTNDLDTETLELLEDLLIKYKGTLLLVSHDRAFINNVVTSTIVFEGDGQVKEYVGGYDDWLQQRSQELLPVKTGAMKKNPSPAPMPKKKPRFGYKHQRELESLPQTLELLEREQKELFHAMSNPDFYKRDKAEIVGTQQRLESIKELLTSAYDRWEELEELKDSK